MMSRTHFNQQLSAALSYYSLAIIQNVSKLLFQSFQSSLRHAFAVSSMIFEQSFLDLSSSNTEPFPENLSPYWNSSNFWTLQVIIIKHLLSQKTFERFGNGNCSAQSFFSRWWRQRWKERYGERRETIKIIAKMSRGLRNNPSLSIPH